MKKTISLILGLVLGITLITGCSSNEESGTLGTINLVSREDGSGTRGAFVEIIGVLEEDSEGNKNDNTYEEAIIQSGTDAVLTTVSGDRNAIGYISLGSLNDRVQALKINGVQGTAENLQNETYKISRPFNIAYSEDSSPLVKDFVNFILSPNGQNIVSEEGYVKGAIDYPEYKESNQEGTLTVAGSTSVSPVMEKLAEKYQSLNTGATIEIQSTGSSAGIQSVIEKSADIGMASRKLNNSEKEGLNHKAIAIDGIVVIVNSENEKESITLEQIKSIYTGEITSWENVD